MSRIIYKIRDKKRINKCGKHFVWVEEQHTLGFLYSKITVEDRFYINLFSVFQSQDCSNIVIKKFYYIL